MNLNILQKSIIATIIYYDILDYPLTGFEIYKYLINPARLIVAKNQHSEIEPINKITLKDILSELNSHNLDFYIGQKNGFYFFKNREQIVATRIERQKISDEKWKKARKTIKLLQIIPYVRMVLVSGSLAMDNVKNESDIDLLIVAKHKRIWTVRFLITMFLQIIGKRRHKNKTKDRFCLNHYVTDEHLKINFPSLYNAQTYAHLINVLEAKPGIYNAFQQANSWINDYLAFYGQEKLANQRKIKSNQFLRFIGRVKEFLLNNFLGAGLEAILRFFQKRLIIKHLSGGSQRGRITTNESQLEFHPASPETKIIDSYNKKILELGFEIKESDSGLI